MDVSSLLSASRNKNPLFDLNRLNAQGIDRLEQQIKDAKATLALADRLQTMRDTTRTAWRIEDSLKNTSSLGRRIDFSL